MRIPIRSTRMRISGCLNRQGRWRAWRSGSLYQLYPDFNIDIAAEQDALARADLIIWQHPMQWCSTPPLLKLWMDKVLSHGWAYGHGGTALHGKHLLWAVTTGGGENHFDIGSHPDLMCFLNLTATALYCGLKWLPPFAMHCTFICDDETCKRRRVTTNSV